MREGSEGKGTLHLAHVVVEDGLRAVGLGQVEAVVDFEALADRLEGENQSVLAYVHGWWEGSSVC